MKIRCGYEISYDVLHPCPMMLCLNVHPDRERDLLGPDEVAFDRSVRPSEYRDVFGNRCVRILAQPGPLTITNEFTIRDGGLPDEVAPDAVQHQVEDLPPEVLVYLLGSRYCETDKLSDTAWSLFGHGPKGWPLVQAIVDYAHDRITFGYQYARSTKTAFEAHQEREGVCRDFAHLAVTLCRCMNIPARYATGYLHPAGGRPDGFLGLVRGLSRRALVHVRCAPQHAARRAGRYGARARRHGCRDRHQLRPLHPHRFQSHNGRIGGVKLPGFVLSGRGGPVIVPRLGSCRAETNRALAAPRTSRPPDRRFGGGRVVLRLLSASLASS
jgi:hypothetical protein